MDLKLQELNERLYKIGLLRNLATNNPIKITLENPNIFGFTVVVVAIKEPWIYPLPANVLWLCADANSIDFKLMLKRTSKSPSASDPQNREHSWERVLTFASVFEPPQYYDEEDDTPDDVLHEQFLAHMDNADNPHGVTAEQADALPLSGGRLTGALFLAREPVSSDEASTKNYIDNRLASSTTAITQLNSALIQTQVDLDGLNTSFDDLETAYTSYVSRPDRTSGYHFDKLTENAIWTITHNLNSKKIILTVYNELDEEILPDRIVKSDNNTVVVHFLVAMRGSAELVVIGQ